MNLIMINRKIVSNNIIIKIVKMCDPMCVYIPLGVGKHSNRWSAITIRLALAVYCRSPAAYGA